jgi:PAS domain S-box-containing protein
MNRIPDLSTGEWNDEPSKSLTHRGNGLDPAEEASCELLLPVPAIEELYAGATEASPDAVVIINQEGQIVLFNRHAELMFGYHRSKVLGQSIEILLPPRLREQHKQQRFGYSQDPRTREMGEGLLLWALHSGGKEFQVQIKLSPMVTLNYGVTTVAVVRRVKGVTTN